MAEIYDIAIIGGGPAGLTAGMYAARAGMKAVLIERAACGGQVLITDAIENFPGFPEGIKGPELADAMLKQAKKFGLRVMDAEVKRIIAKKKDKDPFTVEVSGGQAVETSSLIIATGARWNSLGVPGEKEFAGRGVSYCATCDGPLFKGKDVAVVGGGDTAIEEALFLARFAGKVTVIHRRGRIRATKILQERAFNNGKLNFRLNSIVTGIAGDKKVSGVIIKDVDSGKEEALKIDGVFVLIGITPNSETAKGIVDTDEKGYIVSDKDMRTSVDGIFACGDVREKALRQIVTATGEGAAAAFSAQHYVERMKGEEYK